MTAKEPVRAYVNSPDGQPVPGLETSLTNIEEVKK